MRESHFARLSVEESCKNKRDRRPTFGSSKHVNEVQERFVLRSRCSDIFVSAPPPPSDCSCHLHSEGCNCRGSTLPHVSRPPGEAQASEDESQVSGRGENVSEHPPQDDRSVSDGGTLTFFSISLQNESTSMFADLFRSCCSCRFFLAVVRDRDDAAC